MTRTELRRWAGLSGIVGGFSIAFFIVQHPWGRFVGAEVGGSPEWQLAHTFHFVGAIFMLLGLVGLYADQMEASGRLGFAGFVLAFIGTACFVGTGMITGFVWPMVAREAPAALEPGGAMFHFPAVTPPVLAALFVTVGYSVFGAASWRARVLPRGGVALLTAGAVLGMMAPQPLGPAPWLVLYVGGILFGAGSAVLGWWLARRAPAKESAALVSLEPGP